MTRYVQPVPAPDDPYAGDPLLRSWLERQLGPAGHAAAKGRLADLAADVTGPLRAAHADAEAHPPVLRRYDAWGARMDVIDTAPGWQAQRRAAAEHAVEVPGEHRVGQVRVVGSRYRLHEAGHSTSVPALVTLQ